MLSTLPPGDSCDGRKKTKRTAYVVCSSCETPQGEFQPWYWFFFSPLCLKHAIQTFFPALFLLWGRGMGQEVRNPVLIPQLETEEEETCRESKREDWTTSIAYHFYSATTTDQVRDLWLLFCQVRSCRTKLVFLEVAEFNQSKGAISLALMEITSDIFT